MLIKISGILCYLLIYYGLYLIVVPLLLWFLGVWAAPFISALPFILDKFAQRVAERFEIWLGKKMRDRRWLRTEEGRKWLNTREGKHELKT